MDEVELKILNKELKAQEEAKKARLAEDDLDGNMINDFVAQCDDPNYFRTIYDKITGKKVVLSDDDLDIINRIRKAIYPDPNYDPYEPYVDFFTNEISIHPVMNRPAPKASFIPSLSEKRALTKLVRLIKSGRLKPYQPRKKERNPYQFSYDLWFKEGDLSGRRHRAHIAAPKMPLPGHAESYNPPPEYLLTADDVKKWETMSEEEKDDFFLPQRFSSLRAVPFYKHTIRERFERCLELYMCPRQRVRRAKVDPESLIPKLPRPKDLQPFPSSQSLQYNGHTDIVYSISVEPQGQFMVSGSEDCTVKFWEILTARCWRTVEFDSPVKLVAWCPNAALSVVAVVTSKQIYLLNSLVGDSGVISDTDNMFTYLEQKAANDTEDSQRSDGENDDNDERPVRKYSKQPLTWERVTKSDSVSSFKDGVRFKLTAPAVIEQFIWHPRGDYFSVVMPDARVLSLIIGHMGRCQSQYPLKRGKHLIQRIAFHPSKPRIYAADDRNVFVYDLSKKEITNKLITGLKTTSCLAVHPGGDNLILGSYEPRLVWFDTDLSVKPYKIIRYHKQAIRKACFHRKYPIFASASDDAHVIVSHGMVYDDLTENALIVPLKVLHGHEHTDTLAVSDCEFHPALPWIFSCGADKTARLYT